MAISKVKEVVSRKQIKQEIAKAKKKLSEQSKAAAPGKQNAILRQMLQLEVCEYILRDFFIVP
jgi:hypothetical protein